MTIKVDSELEYVEKYLKALQGLMGLSDRELQVAVAMVSRYMELTKLKNKFKTRKAKAEFDVMKELKDKESLVTITKHLGMSFAVFRNYVSALKHKGFFKNGEINPMCIPSEGKTSVTFIYEGHRDGD